MILRALVEYYDRNRERLPPDGFQAIEISYVIVLNKMGEFIGFESTSLNSGGRTFMVPRAENRQGIFAWTKPNLLWDHYGFVLGWSPDDNDAVQRQHHSFKIRTKALSEAVPREYPIRAVNTFLQNGKFESILESAMWSECVKKKGTNISFRLEGQSRLICENPILAKFIDYGDVALEDSVTGTCLVTGQESEIARLHPQVAGIAERPTPVLAINDRISPAFASFNKSQGFNFPTGKEIASKYTTAMRWLFSEESRKRIQFGGARIVFWADRRDVLEEDFSYYWSETFGDPERSTKAIQALYQRTKLVPSERAEFFVLGLSPNSGRIAIRLWHQGTSQDVSRHIAQHFLDTEIDHPENFQPHLPLKRLLKSIAIRQEPENLAPQIAIETLRSILCNLNYPALLFQEALRRFNIPMSRETRNDRWNSQICEYSQAALIKACINRRTRLRNPDDFTPQGQLGVSLDPGERDVNYRLGRLFSILERIQERSLAGRARSTIRDRFYRTAASRPGPVFSNLMKLAKHQLRTLQNKGEMKNLNYGIEEIMDDITAFPSLMRIDDQGRFAVGYYHQKHHFHKRKNQENPIERSAKSL